MLHSEEVPKAVKFTDKRWDGGARGRGEGELLNGDIVVVTQPGHLNATERCTSN